MVEITKKVREEIEVFVCKYFDLLDKSGLNTEYATKMFAHMSDAQFKQWVQKDFPIQLQVDDFKTHTTFDDYIEVCEFLGINLFERVAEPYRYINSDGKPVQTQKALIGYPPIKRVQQMHTIKNHVSLDVNQVNEKSGRLSNESKSAQMSNREFEGLAGLGLGKTKNEFLTFRADMPNARTQANAKILTTGTLSQSDYDVSRDDSIGRNTISAYMLGCHLMTNLVNTDGYTPYTLASKKQRISRE